MTTAPRSSIQEDAHMKATEHGGNLFTLAQVAQCAPKDIVDFSVNVHPEGVPQFVKEALLSALDTLHMYPSPYAEEACMAAEKRYAHSASCFVFGNGSNELIHAVARFFAKQGKRQAYIVEPAFSEYALACRHAELEVFSLWAGVQGQDDALLMRLSQNIPPESLIFMANPANPAGTFYSRKSMLRLIYSRPDIIWIIDEAFVEYAGEEGATSLTTLSPTDFPKNTLIIRSLTKFHAIAGARLGFLLACEALAQGVRRILPAWTVNSFAVRAALAVLGDRSDFAQQTCQENMRRRAHLVAALHDIQGMQIFPSVANYVLLRHKKAPNDLARILLQKYRIAIRDCSNYHGLEDKTWYRVAVRLPHEHELLCHALKETLI